MTTIHDDYNPRRTPRYLDWEVREVLSRTAGSHAHARTADALPGDAEPTEGYTGRVGFRLDGLEITWRYFRNESAAYKAKANYCGPWAAGWMQVWNYREQCWM